MKFIFLDIDGVLNSRQFIQNLEQTKSPLFEDCNQWIDPNLVNKLNKLIEETGAEVVMSSSWRLDHTKEQLEKLLSVYGFNHQIYSYTPDDWYCERGGEIKSWLKEYVINNKLDGFVILDDLNNMGDLISHLVQTDEEYGLQDCDVEKAINILNGDINVNFNRPTI